MPGAPGMEQCQTEAQMGDEWLGDLGVLRPAAQHESDCPGSQGANHILGCVNTAQPQDFILQV